MNKANDYKIEIGITPHYHDNKHKPYYWIILGFYNDWCNEGFGWAETPEKAWKEAEEYFKSYKSM